MIFHTSKICDSHQNTPEKFGGNFLVKGAEGQAIDREFHKGVLVIHEFPNSESWLLMV